MCIRDRIKRVNWIITDWYRTQAYYNSGGWRATWDGEGGGVLLNQCAVPVGDDPVDALDLTVFAAPVSYTHLDVYKRQNLCQHAFEKPSRRHPDRKRIHDGRGHE